MARRPRGRLRTAVVGGVLLATTALGMPPAPAAGARPADSPAAQPSADLATTLSRLRTLYLQAESATESYDQATRIARDRRAAAERIDRQLAEQRVTFAASRDQAGLLARQMYREGGLSPFLSLLAGQSPQDFFGRKHLLDRAADHQKNVLAGLAGGRARLITLNAQAQHALDAAQRAQSVQATLKSRVEGSLRQIEAVLAGLTGDQISRVRTPAQNDTGQARQDATDGKPLAGDPAARATSTAAGDAQAAQ